MRWTICYGLMILSLGSVVAYGAMNIDELRSPLGMSDRPFVGHYAQTEPAIVLAPSEESAATSADAQDADKTATSDDADSVPPSAAHGVTSDGVVRLTLGMTSDRVFAELGEPDQTSPDGSRWTYGSTTLIFNRSERLAGSVSHDPVQAALNKYNSVMAFAAAASESSNAKSSSKDGRGSKILHYKPERKRQPTRQQKHPTLLTGSSRDARYRYSSLDTSYYMGRSGPMERFFHRKAALPRGMSATHRRNLNATYGTLNNQSRINTVQRRR